MILYILKSSICLLLLLVIYHLLLEQEKMHRFNRFFLLIAILFSLSIPFLELNLDYSFFNSQEPTKNLAFLTSVAELPQADKISNSFYITYVFIGIYFLGFSVMLFRFTRNLARIISQKRNGKAIKKNGYSLILLDKVLPPHSFFNTIFINKSLYEHNKIESCIIEHELIHVTQKHSFDIFFIELIQLVFWFNPIFFFYKKAIKLNHEFLADAAVIASIEDSSQYINTLLKNIFRNNPNYLASSINYSLTKKRFIMMTKNKSKTNMLLKQLALIPLFLCFMFLFSTNATAQEKGASRELMKEYISKTEGNKINLKDIRRLEYIYSLMSDKQKKSVNAIPPPPPPKKDMKAPPPPPFHKDADFYINGKKVDYKKVKELDPDMIKTVNVKKKEGKRGAIYITLK